MPKPSKFARAVVEYIASNLDVEAEVNALITRWQAVNPNVSGTILQGRKAALASMITDLRDVYVNHAATWTAIRDAAEGFSSDIDKES